MDTVMLNLNLAARVLTKTSIPTNVIRIQVVCVMESLAAGLSHHMACPRASALCDPAQLTAEMADLSCLWRFWFELRGHRA
jgi:hypothetical protein